MHPDYEDFYSIAGSLRGFSADQAQFGSFPLPTENTVLAAELLSRAFSELGTPKNLGAICIVELRSEYGITFVINASGEAIYLMRQWIGSTRSCKRQSVAATAVFPA